MELTKAEIKELDKIRKEFDQYRDEKRMPQRYDLYFMPTISTPKYHKGVTQKLRNDGFQCGKDAYHYFLSAVIFGRYLQVKYYPLATEMNRLKKVTCESYRNETRRRTLELIKQKKIKLCLTECSKCGVGPSSYGKNGKLHIHHNDYTNPIDILILCARCHQQLHGAIRRKNNKKKMTFWEHLISS